MDKRADLVSELLNERLDLGVVSLVIDETLMSYYGYNLRYELRTLVKEVIFGKVRMAISVYEGVMDIFLINDDTDDLLVTMLVENEEGGNDFSKYYPNEIYLTVGDIEERLEQGKKEDINRISKRDMPTFKLVATEVDSEGVEKLINGMNKDNLKNKVKTLRETKGTGKGGSTVINFNDYRD